MSPNKGWPVIGCLKTDFQGMSLDFWELGFLSFLHICRIVQETSTEWMCVKGKMGHQASQDR